MNVLVLNCGSSTLKFQVIEIDLSAALRQVGRRLARGLIDPIGSEAACTFAAFGSTPQHETVLIRNHEEAVQKALTWLDLNVGAGLRNLDAVGHRVVHGGDRFTASVLIDDDVIGAIESLNDLAPLHNPACLSGIRACRVVMGPSVPMAAVFDTAFHHTLPEYACIYAIPHELSLRYGIRRYGFHGLAHHYATLRYAEITATPKDRVNIITLHLGNGCSVSAIRGGMSIDTSMGFTPLEGLVMGTRSGDLDPAIVSYLARKEGVQIEEVERWLNQRSGLLGVSGRSSDMRELLERVREDARARLAVEIFCYRARKYVGAYLVALGGADGVVFSGGIGENQPSVRHKICAEMEWCGLVLDQERNAAVVGVEGQISAPEAGLQAYVIPADEEALIARETATIVGQERVNPWKSIGWGKTR